MVTLLESQGSKRSEICSTDLHTIYSNQRSKSTFSQQRKFKQAFMRKKINKTKSVTNSIQLVISLMMQHSFFSFFSTLYLFTKYELIVQISKYKYQSTNLQSFYTLQHKCYVSIKATRSQSDDFEHYKMFQLYKLLGILSEMKCADSVTSRIRSTKCLYNFTTW